MWAALGFAAAALLAEYALPEPGLPYYAAALALFSGLALLRRKRRWRQIASVLGFAALGLLAWWGRYELHVAPCEALAGEKHEITARVTEYPQAGDGYTRLTVRILSGAPQEKAYLYLYHEEMPPVEPGDIVTGTVKTSSVLDRGGTRFHSYTSAGVNMRGYFTDGVRVTGRDERAWLCFPQRLSRFVQERCEILFPDSVGTFMKALLTGDKTDLYRDTGLYGDMRAAGMLHAVAVSGMHVLVILNFLGLSLGRGRRMSLLALPTLVVFTLMAGAVPSVTRAVLMQGILIAAPFFGRESDWPSGIAAALLFILILNPMAIGGIGLQLSFLCVLGFAAFGDPLTEWADSHDLLERGVIRRPLILLFGTFCATVFSIPVSAGYFGVISLLSPLANLLTLPVIEVCFACGYLLCFLSVLLPGAAAVLAGVLSWAVRWCLWVFRGIGDFPLSCLYTVDPASVAWLFLIYGLLIGWLILRRSGRRITPAIPLLLGFIALCAVFLSSAVRLHNGRRELSVLDVGQGECVVYLDKDAAVVLDCGGSEQQSAGDTAADYLLAAGKRNVDILVLSHLHADHTNGVMSMLSRMPVDLLVLPADADDGDGMLQPILDTAESCGTDVLCLSEPWETDLGDLTLTLLLPQAGREENERGIVSLLDVSGTRAMVMGDGGLSTELALAEQGALTDIDVLVAGHHGSATASGAMFLRLTAPETAIVSVGYNSYGLPADEVMDRLQSYCDQVYRTDEQGTVTIDLRTER